MKIFIEKNPLFYPEVRYAWQLIARYLGEEFEEMQEKTPANISIGQQDCDVLVSNKFYQPIHAGIFSHEQILAENGMIALNDRTPDFTSTIFYLVNCIQEYENKLTDEIGRFEYTASAQHRFGNIHENKVGKLIEALCEKFPVLKFPNKNRKSKVFLSHDIDSVYGSLGEDGMWALKNGRIDAMWNLFVNLVLAKPAWLDMKKILDIESDHGFRSVFFWLMNKGKINKREQNADYDFHSPQIQKQVELVSAGGCVNGLHKSISTETMSEEMKRSGFNSRINRNHYLKFTLPHHFNQCEECGLEFDASLGYASHHGFRNNLSLPFVPYNLEKRVSYSFIEIPLNIMDGTFQRYMKLPAEIVANTCIDFLESNKSNAVISILWHNTFFGDYKYGNYCRQYKKILEYLHESNWEGILPQQIKEQNYWC